MKYLYKSVSKIYITLMTGSKDIKICQTKLLKHRAVKAAGIREIFKLHTRKVKKFESF